MSRYDLSALANAPQQKRSRELSQRILAAAEAVLRRDGVENFVISAVAAEAGVSVGGIYGRFQNRQELLVAIHREVITRLDNQVTERLGRGDFGGLAEVLQVFVSEMTGRFREDGPAYVAAPRPDESEAPRRAARQTQEHLLTTLAAAIRPFERELAHPDPEPALRVLLQMLIGALMRRANAPNGPGDPSIAWSVLEQELARASIAYLMCRPPVARG